MKRIVIIGSGNVATSLAHGLSGRCQVAQIYSRTLPHAQRLADAVNCERVTNDLGQLVTDADVYMIAVSDDAIGGVVEGTADNGALWLHTSGSKPIDLFAGQRERYGVMWPMQSFSREVVTPLDEVHLFVEGNDEMTQRELIGLASMLSRHVAVADSEQRRWLHLASVLSCNFANHLWTLADELLTAKGLPFDSLKPLIRTTVDKLDKLSPAASQTGPAARGDLQVIGRHLAMLDGETKEIYRLMTDSIIQHQTQEKDAE